MWGANYLCMNMCVSQADDSDEFYRNTTELSYTLESLRKFQEYNMWVVAYNENGAGTASEEITVRTFSDVPSKPPENITLEAASSTVSTVNCWATSIETGLEFSPFGEKTFSCLTCRVYLDRIYYLLHVPP